MAKAGKPDKGPTLKPDSANQSSRSDLEDAKPDRADLYAMRHSLAHIMATAIAELWPEAKFGVGPVIENGFYYDVDLKNPLTPDDLGLIEQKMREVIKADYAFERTELPLDEAIAKVKAEGQVYKVELLNDLNKHGTTVMKDIDAATLGIDQDRVLEANSRPDLGVESVSFYTDGPFTDLCRGPHVPSTGKVGAFKLTKVSGAYWRGKETNPQMQRVYGVGFATESELKDHFEMLAEAEKRDHRKLGAELDLFTFSDLVGPGLPLYTPRGTVLIEQLKTALKEIGQRYDMQQVSIPHLAKIELYKISGHADKFEEELFRVKSHYNQEFVLKPVNCPHHTQIYAAKSRSYRDLPLRYVEQTMQYRDEKPGQIGGLQRTRGFTVDDGHTFCRVDQIRSEAATIIEIIRDFYSNLGLWGEHWVSLSVRDDAHPEKYIGDLKDWEVAETMLAEVSGDYGLNAVRMEGEAALYGPKLDFMFKDALGRETQLATIQLDFAMPRRFGLTYTDKDGSEQTPVMIHRAILGSFERFLMLIIEHFAGKFPVWLAPEQVRLVTVNDSVEVLEFAQTIIVAAREHNVRGTLDNSNESVGKKIREAELWKVPYTLVIGEKELADKQVTPRARKDLASGESKPLAIDQFIQSVANEAKSRASKASV